MKAFTGILFLPLFSSALLLLIDNAGAEESALERFQRANEAFDLKCLRIVNGKRIEKEVDHQQQQLNKTSANSELEELLPSTGNTFISSFSIGSVLSMALAGAGGDTYQALQNLLGYKHLETMEVLMAYKLISSRLQTTTTTATAAKNDSSNQQQQQQQQLNIANSLAIDKSVTLPYFYLQNIASFFEGKVFREDFSSALLAGKALKEINAWISQQTGGKIPQFFESNSEQQLNQIKLLLLSAVYFKNDWRWKFPKNETKKADFQTSQSATKQVEMMHLKAPLRYARSSDWAESESFWELLELPYQNVSSSQERSAKQLAMYVFLPSSRSNKSVLHSYSLHTLNSLIEQLSPYPKVVVQLPKFHLKSSYSLKKPLEPWLGDSAFSPSKANFSGMIERGGEGNNTGDDHRLYIGEILHKAVISVDEEGAEAAAVTDTEVHPMPHPGPPPPPSPHFIANRPFVFVIREVDTSPEQKGVILFSGVVNDP